MIIQMVRKEPVVIDKHKYVKPYNTETGSNQFPDSDILTRDLEAQ